MTALELSRHVAPGDEAWSRHVMGRIAARTHPPELEQAREHTRQALGLARRLGMAPLEARCHLALAALYQRAAQVLREAG